MKLYILTYHSHHVVGDAYAQNDHIALPLDLEVITAAGYRIVSLATLVERFLAFSRSGVSTNDRYVALTFDDGPVFDVDDFDHPVYGRQPSFLSSMRQFLDAGGRSAQPQLHATAFVIASPIARRTMEEHADAQYTFLTHGSLDDSWWNRAIDTRLIGIANHSFDHLHPALAEVAHSRGARADFTQVDNERDADAQILAASIYIAARTGGRASPFFAYPFGHWNDFLAREYLPAKRDAIGIEAAFTTEARAVRSSDSQWLLPRLTCGHHWTTPQQLQEVLSAG